MQVWWGPWAKIVGGKHLEYLKFIAAKIYASCGIRRGVTRAKYALVLVVAPNTSPEFGLSGPRHGKND